MDAVAKRLPMLRRGVARLYGSTASSSCVHRCKLLVVGAGTGGCSIAWRFARKLKAREIIVLDPSEIHYCQPIFTLIAAGIKKPSKCWRHTLAVLPRNCCWYRDRCAHFDPHNCSVYTERGDQIIYEYMVVAMGLVNKYDEIKGLQEALDARNSRVTTIYSPDYCCKTWRCLQEHCGGHAIFTYPRDGGKCAGAAQKIMYLADHYWRKQKNRDSTSILYNTGGDSLFGVPKYAKALTSVAAARGIVTNFKWELVEVTPKNAVFHAGCKRIQLPYSLLHVCPPMRTPEALRTSCLVNSSGYLDVNVKTLQHKQYPNIFGLGDCTCTPNSKTAAAVAPQSEVVERNLTALMSGAALPAKYDGYGSCPVLTSYRTAIIAEFTYGKRVTETFPFDQSKERFLFYQMTTNLFPYLYWNKLIRGKWSGSKKIRSIINPNVK